MKCIFIGEHCGELRDGRRVPESTNKSSCVRPGIFLIRYAVRQAYLSIIDMLGSISGVTTTQVIQCCHTRHTGMLSFQRHPDVKSL